MKQEFIEAVDNNDTQKVLFLLKKSLPNPIDDKNYAYVTAAEFGNVILVQTFLNDPMVDPNAYRNSAVTLAVKNGHSDIVELLLKDNRIDFSFSKSIMIRKAYYQDKFKIATLLFSNSSVKNILKEFDLELFHRLNNQAVKDKIVKF